MSPGRLEWNCGNDMIQSVSERVEDKRSLWINLYTNNICYAFKNLIVSCARLLGTRSKYRVLK